MFLFFIISLKYYLCRKLCYLRIQNLNNKLDLNKWDDTYEVLINEKRKIIEKLIKEKKENYRKDFIKYIKENLI